MNEYFISYCFYLGLIFVLLIGFGFGFHYLVINGWNNFGQKFGSIAFLPRFIGTPVHELGHLIFAVLTGSRIRKVKLFPNIDSRTRSCGGAYVKFSPRSGILGSLSCFLSGIGPMIFCPFTIMILMYYLTPQLFHGVVDVFEQVTVTDANNLLTTIGSVIQDFYQNFDFVTYSDWRFWIFIILAIPIANECVLSRSDIQNAWKGFVVLLIFLLLLGFLLSLIPTACTIVVTGLAKGASLLLCVLTLGLLFNLIHWILGSLVKWFL